MQHNLKIEEQYLENLLSGRKKAEIRINDRDYQVGDSLRFYHYDAQKYVTFGITHIHSGLGMDKSGCGYVCLSVERIER